VPLQDKLAERVSRHLQELAHALVENEYLVQEELAQPVEPKAPAQGTEQVAVEFTNFFDTEFDRGEDMVTQKTMTIDRFVPRARQTVQQQPPQGRGQTPLPPPPPPTERTQKRQCIAEQTSTGLGDVVTRTPLQPSRGIVIQEPQTQVGASAASSSQAAQAWQPTFQLDGESLPVNASVRVWEKGEGGCVVQSLVHDLLLLEDVHAFEEGTEESMGRRLQWHTIAVIFRLLISY